MMGGEMTDVCVFARSLNFSFFLLVCLSLCLSVPVYVCLDASSHLLTAHAYTRFYFYFYCTPTKPLASSSLSLPFSSLCQTKQRSNDCITQ